MSCIVFSSAHDFRVRMLAAPAKKNVGLLRVQCPPTAPALPVAAHGDLGTSRLRAAEADVTRRLARVKEASRAANDQLRTDLTPRQHFSIRGAHVVVQSPWLAAP